MLLLSIVFPLALTLVIETGIYMILKHRDLKLFIVISFTNLLLNPTMNIILFYLGDSLFKYWLILGIGEVLTTLIESIVIYLTMRFKYLKILLFSFIANLVSFLIGLACEQLYGYKAVLIIITIVLLLIYLVMYLFVIFTFIKKNKSIN